MKKDYKITAGGVTDEEIALRFTTVEAPSVLCPEHYFSLERNYPVIYSLLHRCTFEMVGYSLLTG